MFLYCIKDILSHLNIKYVTLIFAQEELTYRNCCPSANIWKHTQNILNKCFQTLITH